MNKIYGPDKVKCHQSLHTAVVNGKIEKPEICTKCGNKHKIEGHHEDYSKPLEVVWLCMKCHRALHAKPKHYLVFPKIFDGHNTGVLPLPSSIFVSKYRNCTYNITERVDIVRDESKRTLKVYDSRGFIVYKEEYYIK